MKSRMIMALAAIGILALSSIAQATTNFTIKDTTFTNLVGNNDGFQWTLGGAANQSFDLDLVAGGNPDHKTFTYGKVTTTDFSLDSGDLNNNDSFTANFTVVPPGLPGQSEVGDVNTWRNWFIIYFDHAKVDFDNSVNTVLFGNGGRYNLTFLDTDEFNCDGTYDLRAEICLLQESAPVPEPGTMMLLGAGFLGLAVYGKRRKNA